jgi:hypothetical protein
LGRFQIERQGALVAIESEKAGGLALQEWGGGAGLISPVRIFNLDHVRAEIGELHRAERRRHEVADLDDANTCERSVGHMSLPAYLAGGRSVNTELRRPFALFQ